MIKSLLQVADFSWAISKNLFPPNPWNEYTQLSEFMNVKEVLYLLMVVLQARLTE